MFGGKHVVYIYNIIRMFGDKHAVYIYNTIRMFGGKHTVSTNYQDVSKNLHTVDVFEFLETEYDRHKIKYTKEACTCISTTF